MASMLSQRALLATLAISTWNGRRLDRSVTQELNESKGASADASRVNKDLIGREALAAIGTAEKAARAAHYHLTLPWTDGGARMLSVKAHNTYLDAVQKYERAFESAVEDFLDSYPSHVQSRRAKLGAMFDAADYPTLDELRGKFRFRIEIDIVPDSKDFRADVTEEQSKIIVADIERRIEEKMQEALRSVVQRIVDVASRMSEKLKGYRPPAGKDDKAEGVFRDTLVENVRDLAKVLPSLNITNDPALARLIDEVDALTIYDAKDLREDETARKDVAKVADDILAKAAQLFA